MFAGHDETGAKVVEKDGKKYMEHYGSSSRKAMEKNYGKMKKYRSSEGREILVPYRGAVKNTVRDMLGGLRSACTYVGARKLKELSKRTTFVLVNRQLNTLFEKRENNY